jgi:hypothetical protein
MVHSKPVGSWLPEARAFRRVFSVRSYLLSYPFLALGVGVSYALLLPGLPLGTLAPWVLQFLKPSELAFAITMGILLPPVALLNVFLWRNPHCSVSTKRRSNGGLLSVLLGVVPNALCCTPIVPAIVALFASGATLIAISAPVQYFFNTYAWVLYSLATIGVWLSLRIAALRFITY